MASKLDAYYEAINSGAYKHHKEDVDRRDARPSPEVLVAPPAIESEDADPWYKDLPTLAMITAAILIVIAGWNYYQANKTEVLGAVQDVRALVIPQESVTIEQQAAIGLIKADLAADLQARRFDLLNKALDKAYEMIRANPRKAYRVRVRVGNSQKTYEVGPNKPLPLNVD